MIYTVLLLTVLLSSSAAEVVPCWVVKRAVAHYGEAAVEAFARAKGFSPKDIERARRCLKS
jgi:hypothetical protein